MNVFEFGFPLEFARGNFASDLVEAADDGYFLGLGEHADFVEHFDVRHRAEDVMTATAGGRTKWIQ